LLPVALARIYALALPAAILAYALALPSGEHAAIAFMGLDLQLLRVDKLSTVFGTIFLIALFLGNLYAWHEPDRLQRTSAQIYAGAAIGAAFVGDLVSLFVFWELRRPPSPAPSCCRRSPPSLRSTRWPARSPAPRC
jgi:multicomponent Na+:H+ antiporter subunit D